MGAGHAHSAGLLAKVWPALVLSCALLFGALGPARAAVPGATLQDVEAAYILKFATYVQWPKEVFHAPAAPLVVGVMNDLDLARALERATLGRRINGRTVQVRFMGVNDAARGLHVLVLPRSDHPARRRILHDVAARPILTVAPPEHRLAADSGPAIVQLVLDEDRLRFDVDIPSRNAGLRISALMLTAARRVEDRMPN